MEHHRPADLARLIHPRSIALVGASERAGSIGERTLTNLLTHSELAGPLYLVNPSRAELRGQRCWPSVAALPATPDVVVVAVPASGVLAVIGDCAARGVAFAVILSSGFGEAGDQGRRQEQRLQEIAARSGLRLYGPNCPGLTNVNQRLGLTFSPSFPHDLVKGPIGLATQGGGLGRNVMQAMERGIGIGLWASTGNEVDLQVADFIHYMADAPDIRVIVSLLEGIKDGPKFVAAVQRAAANGKPVIVLKVGKSEYGRRAVQSHTAALTGSAQVNSAIFRQFGVVEVDDIDELADTAWLFARAMPGAREALGIYCSSGGTAALTADAVGAAGLRLAAFTPETTALLRARLPDYAAIGNPVDTTAMVLSDQTVVETTLGRVASDANLGLTIVPIALDYGASTTRMADCIIHAQQGCAAPIVPIWMSDRLGEGYQRLVAAGFAPPRSVGKAVSAIRRWVEYGRYRRANPDVGALQRPLAQPGQRAHDGGATRSLGEAQAKQMLQQAGVRLMPNALAKSADEALAHAGRIGYPVVAKIVSADIAHKSDIGGVQVGLRDAAQLQAAWHTIMSTVTARQPGARIAGLLIEKMAAPGS
ncbi:acetate--CoA ligase family protein, partial [Verminephrobacter sp. Larva24]